MAGNTCDTPQREPHICSPENAQVMLTWIKTRGGIAIWDCYDLGNPGQTWTTPVTNADGTPVQKPHWAAGKIIRVITDPGDVLVYLAKEVKRFHVAVRRGSGTMLVLSDAASRRVNRELKKAGPGSWYEFDYYAHDNCVILVPDNKIPLDKWQGFVNIKQEVANGDV